MFGSVDRPSGPPDCSCGPLDAGGVVQLAGRLRCLSPVPRRLGSGPVPATQPSSAELVDQLSALEQLKSAAAAAQARVSAALDESVRAERAARGLPDRERGRGVAAQVALARRESAHRGGRHLGLATALVREMPHTLAALEAGRLSEWRATLLVRETACLGREDRSTVDRELCADPAVLDGMGDRAVAAMAGRIAYRLDPHAALARTSRAGKDRRVTLRPAPDTMGRLAGLVPVAQAVAALAALRRAADEARASGDPRSRDQVMADTFVERLTGQATAAGVPISVGLVMTDATMLHGDDEPAFLAGFGPVPATWARAVLRPARFAMSRPDLVAAAPSKTGKPSAAPAMAPVAHEAQVWLRRFFADPETGELVSMESKARDFPPPLRGFLVARDQVCRTPWCDAPIRHADHARRAADGGPTSADNGQGLCERCNYDKDSPGWSSRPAPPSRPGRHRVVTTTPTGHSYVSRPPPQPGGPLSRLDRIRRLGGRGHTRSPGTMDVAFARLLDEQELAG